MMMTVRHALVPAYLALCVILGGASLPSFGGYRANLVLQLLAIPIILWSLLTVRRTPMERSARILLILTAIAFALPLLYLIPLPPSLWTSLPGREAVAQGYALLGQPLPWLPLSLTPDRTLSSVLWLLPALAVLLGIIRLGAFRASWIAASLVLVTLLGIFVGALQVAGNLLYFYKSTNFGFAVGFFANANHMSTLMLVAIAFLAGLAATGGSSRRRSRRSAGKGSGRALMFGAAFVLVLVGLGINRSAAGIGLALPVAAASFLLVRALSMRAKLLTLGVVAAATVGAIVLIFLMPIGGALIGGESASAESRVTSISKTLAAAGDHFPTGSGIGSFADVYRSSEDPAAVGLSWMNHAHSDYAELLLELGLPGVILVVLFFIWWVARATALWSQKGDSYARAATIASAAILAHSLVDYPLRTAAISAVLAACCALMTQPRERGAARRDSSPQEDGPRHLTA